MGIVKDSFEVSFLEDGSVQITTGPFSGPLHASAEALMRAIQADLGPSTRVRITHTHTHTHEHDHEHEGHGHGHSH